MQKPKAYAAKTPDFNWSDYRRPDLIIEVTFPEDSRAPETVRHGSLGHACLTPTCDSTLVWLQKTTLNRSLYQAYCRTCCLAWPIPHKYLFKLINAQRAVDVVLDEEPREELPREDLFPDQPDLPGETLDEDDFLAA